MLPPAGKNWAPPTPPSASESLHLTGGRAGLALVRLSASDAARPVLEGFTKAGTSLGMVSLAAPSSLPRTEAGGAAYGSDLYSATLPASWMADGLQLRASADNYLPSTSQSLLVGADMPFVLRVLPFYLFGATEANTGKPLSASGMLPADAATEFEAKVPVAAFSTSNHPAGKLSWPTLVVPPRQDSSGTRQPAYVMSHAGQAKDGFAPLSTQHSLVRALKLANGEDPTNVQYYAPLIMLNAAGAYAHPGGGIGGSDVGTGDDEYRGIFIHEQGHAFGLPHQGEAFDDGKYPYDWGSLNGSLWGYDAFKRELLAPFVPSTASRFASCRSTSFAGHARAVDSAGRCVKNDPMQSGSGDQASGYRFATFSDYSAAMMQRNLEGVTVLNADGTRRYDGGKIVPDASFPGGYKRWDTLDRRWVNVEATTQSNGIFGLDRNLPQARGVPVHAVVITLSNAGTAGATQIYPTLRYTGNRLRYFDPTSAADRAQFVPDTSANPWYCRNGGCDYTLRATYANGTVRHVLLQGGFRPFNEARGAPPASASDPLDGNSFRRFAIHLPDDGALSRVELLSTPRAWEGVVAAPPVLATR